MYNILYNKYQQKKTEIAQKQQGQPVKIEINY